MDERMSELRQRIQELSANRPDRQAGTGDLTGRFAELLAAFGFPKLDEPAPPYLDQKFVPYVRGNRYPEIGSTGPSR